MATGRNTETLDLRPPGPLSANDQFHLRQLGLGKDFRVPGDMLRALLGALPTNDRPGGPFLKTVLTPGSIGYASGNSRDDIAAENLCIGARCYTEFNDGPDRSQGQIDKILYDVTGPLLVYGNGDFNGPRNLPARWARVRQIPNDSPGVSFRTTLVSTSSTGYVAGTSTRDGLNPDNLCLGADNRAELGDGPGRAPQVDILVYDGAPRTPDTGLYVHRDGDFAEGDFVPAKWVAKDAPEAFAPAYDSFPAGYSFTTGEFMRSYAGGSTENFYKRLTPGGPAPDVTATGGDANWELSSGSAVPMPATTVLFQRVTQAQAINLLDNEAVVPGRLYAITIGSIEVWVVGLDNATLSGVGDVLDPGNSQRTTPVKVDVRSGAVAPLLPAATASTAGIGKLYTSTGSNTDGALTQKAASDAFALKAGIYNTIDYLNQVTLSPGDDVSGWGKSFLTTGGENLLYDPVGTTTVLGRIIALRNTGTTSTDLIFGATTTSRIDGAVSLTLLPKEWVILRVFSGGYTVEQRGRTDEPYTVPAAVVTAVVAGTFSATGSTFGEMTTPATPTGSQRGMRFKKGQAKYEFMPNDAGTADVWVRSPVG